MSLSSAALSVAAEHEGSSLDLSVVVPIYNEEESLPELVEQLLKALRPTGERFELVVVNDGSADNTAAVLEQISEEVPELVGVILRKNYSKIMQKRTQDGAKMLPKIITKSNRKIIDFS